jgi:enamine deaminase RidA (YjgF/YER057c/UK114 family)
LYAYRRYGWSVGKFGEDRHNLVGTKAPKKKRIKKFEDYWDEESEDNTGKQFPTRAAANVSTFEDYWDESVDFSSHSSDALNFSK